MVEALVILQPRIAAASRAAVSRLAPATQAISERVFLGTVGESGIERLRAMDGVAAVLTSSETGAPLPELDDAESLFARAWLSSRGRIKTRRGDGLDWDTPPMLPPDPKP